VTTMTTMTTMRAVHEEMHANTKAQYDRHKDIVIGDVGAVFEQ